MEYCSYEDAFPNVGGSKEKKKKSRDPDRLTPKMEAIEPLSREETTPPPPAAAKKKKNSSYFTTPAVSPEEGWKEAPFTDVIGNDASYRLYPDFQAAFKRIVSESGAAGVPSTPSVFDEWKPLTPNHAARSAFFDELPPPGSGSGSPRDGEPTDLAKKIDRLFSRLDDLESRRGENTQTEILMFVMSGLFVLFSMDILTRH